MKYTRQTSTFGSFVDKKALVNGARAKIMSECVPQESEYQGKPRTRNIVKVKFEDIAELQNVDLNGQTRNALIDAFGEDSKDWIGQILTVHTEKTIIGGKRVIVLYLVPKDYEVGEDAGGYVVIGKKGAVEEKVTTSGEIEYPEEEVDPESIPF